MITKVSYQNKFVAFENDVPVASPRHCYPLVVEAGQI